MFWCRIQWKQPLYLWWSADHRIYWEKIWLKELVRFWIDKARGSVKCVGNFGRGSILDMTHIFLIAHSFIHNFNNNFRIIRMNKSNFRKERKIQVHWPSSRIQQSLQTCSVLALQILWYLTLQILQFFFSLNHFHHTLLSLLHFLDDLQT